MYGEGALDDAGADLGALRSAQRNLHRAAGQQPVEHIVNGISRASKRITTGPASASGSTEAAASEAR